MKFFTNNNKVHIIDTDKNVSSEKKDEIMRINEIVKPFRNASDIKYENNLGNAIILIRDIRYGDGVIVKEKEKFILSPTIERRDGISTKGKIPTAKQLEELHPRIFTSRVVEEETGCCGNFLM